MPISSPFPARRLNEGAGELLLAKCQVQYVSPGDSCADGIVLAIKSDASNIEENRI